MRDKSKKNQKSFEVVLDQLIKEAGCQNFEEFIAKLYICRFVLSVKGMVKFL